LPKTEQNLKLPTPKRTKQNPENTHQPHFFFFKNYTKKHSKIRVQEPNINSSQSSNNSMNTEEKNRGMSWFFWYQIHSLLQNSMHGFFLVSHLNQKLIYNSKGESF